MGATSFATDSEMVGWLTFDIHIVPSQLRFLLNYISPLYLIFFPRGPFKRAGLIFQSFEPQEWQ